MTILSTPSRSAWKPFANLRREKQPEFQDSSTRSIPKRLCVGRKALRARPDRPVGEYASHREVILFVGKHVNVSELIYGDSLRIESADAGTGQCIRFDLPPGAIRLIKIEE